MKHVIGWVLLGGVLGAASLVDPLGLVLAAVVLVMLIGAKMRTMAPGLVLVGAGAGATVVLLVVERSSPDTVTVGVPLTLGVVLVGGLWGLRDSASTGTYWRKPRAVLKNRDLRGQSACATVAPADPARN
jgi:hypothetical protein